MKYHALVLGAFLASYVLPVHADELQDIFKKVEELTAAKNYSKAMEELGWANKYLEKLHNQKLQSLLPNEVDGYVGGKIDASGAFGISSMERSYTKTGAPTIKLSLTGGAGNAAQGGLGGLAALGKMAAMMGGQPGMDTLRISGRTATLETRDSGGDLSVFLDSGSILKLEMSSGDSTMALKNFAEKLNLNELDNYIRGQS